MPRLASRPATLLAAIGLVLVGLLAGILAMLALRPSSQVVVRPTPTERVELGGAPVADTSVAQVPPRLGSDEAPLSPTSVDVGALNNLFREVADHVTPSVVFIRVETGGGGPSGWLNHFEGDDDARRYLERMPRQSVGSGVVIAEEGYIVTNHHVVAGAEHVEVMLSDRREFEAEVVGVDPSTDLAVIRVDTQGERLPALRFANSDEVEVGEWVLAIGNPFRLHSTVTAGIVSALGRQVGIIEDDFRVEDFIQTDAAINPGNSGGAVVNLRGELVGIATAIATETGTNEGYGFAVPVNLMERIASDLIAYGEVRRGFLGVEIREITARGAERLGLDRVGGVYLGRVTRGGAADQAGLVGGDVVLAIDGRRVDAPNELQSIVARRRPGDRLELSVWRDGDVRSVDVELMSRDAPAYRRWLGLLERGDEPAPEDPPAVDPDAPGVLDVEGWDVGLRDLSARDRRAFGAEEGAYVAYVARGGQGDDAGLPRGTILTHVEGEPVADAEDAREALRDADAGALLQVLRRDGTAAFYEAP